MEPITGSIISALVVRALTGVTQPAVNWALGRIKSKSKKAPPVTLELEAGDLAISLLAELRSTSRTPTEITRLASFLRTQEAATITRQLLVAKLTDQLARYDSDLRSQLTAVLVLTANLTPQAADQASSLVYNTIADACDRLVSKMETDDRMASLRPAAWNELFDIHLSSIARASQFYATHTPQDLASVYVFEQAYREQVHARHRFITPPHLDQRQRVPLDNLYVLPRLQFWQLPRRQQIETRPTRHKPKSGGPSPGKANQLAFEDFLKQLYRTVVLGDPGAGKSTLALKIIHDLSRPTSERSVEPFPTPILVVLRDYGTQRKQRDQSILRFIEAQASSNYQLAVPPGAFEYLMVSGRAMVIFDGLDELLETQFRQQVAEDVELFCNRYPQARVLVTSRKVGYELAPLDEKAFSTFHLADFNVDQVRTYATKWFGLGNELSTAQQKTTVSAFLKDSKDITDLRSNALMLGLLCNIYRGQHYIPRNRPEVYRKCAEMLFDRWDLGRGIKAQFQYRVPLDPVIKHLAFWIYSTQGLSAGVTERKLIQKTEEYLLEWLRDDPVEANEAAKEFISFCRGRAWVFTDTGTTPAGEPLYQFTHRTFLEYFAAAQLVRMNATPTHLWLTLSERIARGEWELVAQLAVQIQNWNIEGAVDEFLQNLMEAAVTASRSTAENYLSFATECLHILTPRPRITRRLGKTCVAFDVKTVDTVQPRSGQQQEILGFGWDPIVAPWVEELLNTTDENISAVTAGVLEGCEEIAYQQDETLAARALQIALNLERLYSFERTRQRRSRSLTSTAERFAAESVTKFRHIAQRRLAVALSYLNHGKVSVSDIVRWYGPGGVVRSDHGIASKQSAYLLGNRYGVPNYCRPAGL
jgi:NACHT domain